MKSHFQRKMFAFVLWGENQPTNIKWTKSIHLNDYFIRLNELRNTTPRKQHLGPCSLTPSQTLEEQNVPQKELVPKYFSEDHVSHRCYPAPSVSSYFPTYLTLQPRSVRYTHGHSCKSPLYEVFIEVSHTGHVPIFLSPLMG